MLLLLLLAQVSTTPRRQATVVLREPCLAEYLMAGNKAQVHERMMSAEGAGYRAGLRRSKAPLVARIRQRGIPVTAQIETILNAVMVDATDDELIWLRVQPEVQAADFAIRLTAGLDAATSLIGAPQIWTQLGGQDNTGKGIKIGVLDSGIDVGNPMFSDAGFPASTLPGNSYTNNKVIIAKNYVVCSQDSSCNPTFDNSPADGYGHGSHVASIAAGRCTPTPLGPTICGVAPGAFLGSYKVFDATNHYATSTWVLNALNDAVADGMDVINFSGGSINNGGFGTQPGNAFLYVPIHNASSLGVVISICAGNCGPVGSSGECGTLFGDGSIWTPAVEPDAISVGASTNAHFPAFALKITASAPVPANLQSIAMGGGSFPTYTDFGPAPLLNITSVDPTGLACGTLPAGSLSGNIAMVQRGTCPYTTKIASAAAAGAVGVLVYDNIEESLFGISTGGASIPSALIGLTDGVKLAAFLAANPGAVQATFGGTLGFAYKVPDLVANYSSRGPNTDFSIKPDLVAPGDIYAAVQRINPSGNYDASGFSYGSGTSYATPLVTGGAAVLKQLRPGLTAKDYKSALVNTAVPVTATQDGAAAGVMQAGAGRLSLPAAVATTLVSDPVSVSFGHIAETSSAAPAAKSIAIKNLAAQADNVAISVVPLASDPIVQATATTASNITTISVQLATPAPHPGVYEGFIVVKSQNNSSTLRIPYWVMFGTPAVNAGGLVDAASYGVRVSPGDIVSLFGTDLGGAGVNASTIPLPNDLSHSVITVTQGLTSTTMPLFYAGAQQVNFQLPYTLTSGSLATVTASMAGLKAPLLSFTPSAVSPGIFAVVHAVGGGPVTPSSPATVGEFLTIYCAGLGPVTPAVTVGSASPIPAATTTATPTISIGGQPATRQFSGLTPQLVGLYQVNAVVPAGLSGAQPLSITISGVTSNSVPIYVQ